MSTDLSTRINSLKCDDELKAILLELLELASRPRTPMHLPKTETPDFYPVHRRPFGQQDSNWQQNQPRGWSGHCDL